MSLRAVHPAFTGHSSGPDGNDRLQCMETRAERIRTRIQERQHTLTLIVIKRIPNNGQSNKDAGKHQQQKFPA